MNMITMDKKYTYEGRPARILAVDVKNDFYPVVALITEATGIELVEMFTADGREHRSLPKLSLIEVRPEHTVWVNCYANSSYSHSSRERADQAAIISGPHGILGLRLACVQLTYQEGEGLPAK